MTITLADVRQKVRDRIGDDPVSPATPFYTTAYINRVIDARVQARVGLIYRLAPNYYMAEYTFASVAAQADYDLTGTLTGGAFGIFVKLERVFGSGSTATYQETPYRAAEDQSTSGVIRPILALPDSVALQRKTVSIWKGLLRLDPPPVDATETYRLKYLRKPTPAAGIDGSAIDVPDEWGEFIAADVAVQVGKRRGDARWQLWQSERTEEYKQLTKQFHRLRMPITPFGRMEVM